MSVTTNMTADDHSGFPKPRASADYAAALALAVFFLGYGSLLIGYAFATKPPPRYDAFGQVMPDLFGEGLGYMVVGILIAFLSHLLVFVVFRWRHRTWPLLGLLPLQIVVIAGSLEALRVVDPVLAVLVAPAVATFVVYGVAALIVRAERISPLTR